MAHVLIPLDGSPLAEAVIPLALDLLPEEVTLLHVEDEKAPLGAESVFAGAERQGLDPSRCKVLVRRGRPADAIIAVAAEIGATVIALSSHGRTGWNRLVMGSVAEEVVRAANRPVLLTRSGAPAPRRPLLSRALVGYDGSDHAWRAVEALALLGRARMGEIALLGVLEVQPFRPAEADELIERLIARQRDALLGKVTQAAARAKGLGLSATSLVREGRPATVLLDHADETQVTLLAVATKRSGTLSRWVFGSVAEELLHSSTVPLLVTR